MADRLSLGWHGVEAAVAIAAGMTAGWCADPTVALAIGRVALREAREAWQGEGSGCC
jgi:hypothetical protein